MKVIFVVFVSAAVSGVCLAGLGQRSRSPLCPDDPSGNVTFFPHPTNCSQYLECDNGQLTVMECPDGLQFNPELNVCDFEENVGCENEEEEEKETEKLALTFLKNPVCSDDTSGNVTFFPHPTNCSQYLECDNGELTVMECPDGLQFNPVLDVCDFKENVECENEEGETINLNLLLLKDPVCTDGSSGNVTFFPHPTNCSEYLECDNGQLTVMECPDGLHFNPELDVCDFAENVDCEDVLEEDDNVKFVLNILQKRMDFKIRRNLVAKNLNKKNNKLH